MQGYVGDIEKLVKENRSFRKVLYTASHSQLVVMNLKPGEEIGEEIHDVDQFFRFESGEGKVSVDGNESQVGDGTVVIVPAGARHNVINMATDGELKLYTLYCPPHHQNKVEHVTKEEAEGDTEHFDGATSEE